MEMMKKIIAKTNASGHLDDDLQLPPDCFIEIFIPMKNSDPKSDSAIRKPHPAIAGAMKINCDLLKSAIDEDEMELD